MLFFVFHEGICNVHNENLTAVGVWQILPWPGGSLPTGALLLLTLPLQTGLTRSRPRQRMPPPLAITNRLSRRKPARLPLGAVKSVCAWRHTAPANVGGQSIRRNHNSPLSAVPLPLPQPLSFRTRPPILHPAIFPSPSPSAETLPAAKSQTVVWKSTSRFLLRLESTAPQAIAMPRPTKPMAFTL